MERAELTLRGMVLGALLTVIFTASNVYLGLKVGITFSSAIPAAVISMAVLGLLKGSNILENNMVQTQASAAGTLSAIIFIIPGMLMIGYWQQFEFWQTLMVSACGGFLGVLFTIPLRRAMVVHSDLPYPEGRAAAEILKVGEASGTKGAKGIRELLTGGGIAGLIALFTNGFQILTGGFSTWLTVGKGITQLSMGYSTALIGAGYLIGLSSGLALLTGLSLAWLVLIPYFTMTGVPADGQTLQEFAQACYVERVRLIGAGVMGVAAIWTLLKMIRPVVEGMKESIQIARQSKAERNLHRTDTDMSIGAVTAIFILVLIGLLGTFYSFVSAAGLPLTQTLTITVVGIIMAVIVGFIVATACAYMAGLVGTSTSPISGIGILATVISSLVIMMLCNVFDIFELPNGEKFATATAIFATSIVIAVACISNDNMQDLKTGFLVGATPRNQQIALLLGCLIGAFIIAPVLELLYQAYGFTGALPRPDMEPDNALTVPQATLMTMIAQGIFSGALAWEYIGFGLGLSIAIIVVDALLKKINPKFALPPLAVGMGVYLPESLLMPLIIGAVMGWLLERSQSKEAVEEGRNRGTLFASGLIVGESLIGVLLAIIIAVSISSGGSDAPLAFADKDFRSTAEILGLTAFATVMAIFCKVVRGKFF